VVARFLCGLAIGASSVLGPMYIAEIAPPKQRGRLVGMFQFNIVLGILVAYLSNYLIGLAALGDTEWRWKLGISAIPAALFLLMLYTIAESPRWLAKQGRVQEAEDVLRGTGDPDYKKDLAEIVASVESQPGDVATPLFQQKYRFPIFLAISIAMFNQLSGINAVLYYLNDIFAKAGFTKVSSDLQAVAVGATNLLFTIAAMSVIDKVGRKTLLLIGSVGTALALSGVAAIFFADAHHELLVWCLVGFIASFAFSQGAVIWVYLSEVFPTSVRAKGQSLGSSTHWVMNAIIAIVFPMLAASSGGAPFVFFAVMMVVQFFVVLSTYPETKGYTLEEMQHKLGGAA
jgi:MFS transporter, SP family, arabinose:H+ symporter